MLNPAVDNTSHAPPGGLSSQCRQSVPSTASSVNSNCDLLIAISYVSANAVLCYRYSVEIFKSELPTEM
jgi:hypothetical protein